MDENTSATELALRESEERYKALLEAVDVGFCIIKMKFDDTGKAIDYLLVEGNPAFERQTGLVGKFGKWVSEVAPGLEQHWFDAYGRVALTGEPVHFENGAQIFGRFYDVRAHRVGDPDKHRVAIVFNDISDRRRIEVALRESEQQFRVFAQTVPNHVWAGKPNGDLYWFNDQVYFYVGASPGELDGAAWTSIVHPDDLPGAGAAWSHALETGELYETEFRIRNREGDFRWFLVRAKPVIAADGTITSWIGTNTDVHERKLAETESARDRDRVWALSQDLMLVCGFDGVITSVNPSATRILGWTEGEMIGKALGDFLHPDDLASTAAEVEKLAHGATTLAFENRYRTKDGSYRLLDWTAVPDQGRIHAVGRDITNERAVTRERERTWVLSPVLKLVITAGGTILTINPGFTRTLGWEAKDLIGKPIADFLVPGDRETSASRRAKLMAGEQPPEYQLGVLTKDGAQRVISWTTVLEDDTIFAFGRDVTTEREQAEALAKSEEALRQSQKMEAVGQLTGGLAHDFNNLLAGISGSLDMMQTRIAQGRIADLDKYMIGAQGAAKRAAALTHRLLAFSRRQTLEPKPTDANRLITEMEDLIRRTVGPHILVESVGMAGLWSTKVDPPQLENALLNLCLNARDAMPDGGKITIETGNRWLDERAAKDRDLPPGQYISLCVSDNGTGMSADVIVKAFDPFFTTKPIGVGTGLGLSMIYGFARQSGGSVRIYSEVGQGTMVCIYLPRHHANEGDVATVEPGADLKQAETGTTVLVIDDEPLVRMLMVDVLNDLGYTTLEAGDGPEGMKILRSEARIDLLITDVGLPNGMNGRQVADAARQLRPKLKVLFVTGYAENAVLSHGHLDPGMQVATKPFEMTALANRIEKMIADG